MLRILRNADILLNWGQFFVQLCFTITIQEVWSETLGGVLIYFEELVFKHDQLYIASNGVLTSGYAKVLLTDNRETENVAKYSDVSHAPLELTLIDPLANKPSFA